MRLLVITQAVDAEDVQLGFFVEWLVALAPHYEYVEVICLKEGAHTLPANVRVRSLGKERESGSRTGKRMRYVGRFFRALFTAKRYDAVFVHMNQEYVLLAGLWWRLLRRPVYLWRNHYSGSFLTDIAARLSRRVFYTSRYSYTARFPHAIQMPVGIDTERFAPGSDREPRAIVSVGRVAPSKRLELLVDALHLLHRDAIAFVARIYGDPLPQDRPYLDSLRSACEELGIAELSFHPGVPHRDVPAILSRASVFVNVSKSGMLDKTIFEAASAGCLVLARSDDYHAWVDERFRIMSDEPTELAQKLRALLVLPPEDEKTARERLRAMVIERHGLSELARRLHEVLV